jgi:DNA-binding transcriptional MerR regulator
VRPSRNRLNHRRYGAQARATLQTIALMRRAGLGLEEIRTLIAEARGDTPQDRTRGMLSAATARLQVLEGEAERTCGHRGIACGES